MIAASSIDLPPQGSRIQRHVVVVEGWVLEADARAAREVVVEAGDATIGRTRHLFVRLDVTRAYDLEPGVRTGFAVPCRIPEELRDAPELDVRVRAVLSDGETVELGTRRWELSSLDYRSGAHGYVLADTYDAVVPRDVVYRSGPPSEIADEGCVDLIARYLQPGARILDVGCGIGAYAGPLTERGYRWTGCEVRPEFVAQASAKGLDVRATAAGERLPFADGAFDAAIAIEVLEHVEDYDAIVTEIRRVAPTAFFSVPNFEAIPMTSSLYALPWHMLEPDHRNFFSRASLRSTLARRYSDVDVLEYGALPVLHARDGLPIFNHLFAIATDDG